VPQGVEIAAWLGYGFKPGTIKGRSAGIGSALVLQILIKK
jgi:hypothetical protein